MATNNMMDCGAIPLAQSQGGTGSATALSTEVDLKAGFYMLIAGSYEPPYSVIQAYSNYGYSSFTDLDYGGFSANYSSALDNYPCLFNTLQQDNSFDFQITASDGTAAVYYCNVVATWNVAQQISIGFSI